MSLIRQKGESHNGCFKKTKHVKFSEKRTSLTPLIRIRMCDKSKYQILRVRIRGLRNVRFSENLTCFVFLKHPFWDSPFCLITDDLWFFEISVTRFLYNYSIHNYGQLSSIGKYQCNKFTESFRGPTYSRDQWPKLCLYCL